MTSLQLNVYDPAMCCSTGVCGPEVDPDLVRFAADLDWIAKQGAPVRRYNLAQEPSAFTGELVRQVLQREGEGALPLIVVEGEVVSRGRYPTRHELKGWAGLEEAHPYLEREAPAGSCCGGDEPTSQAVPGSGSGCC